MRNTRRRLPLQGSHLPNASPPVPRAHSHVVPIGIIAGATVGGVAALTILVLFGANFLRKCSRGTICDEKPAIRSGVSGESSEGNHGIPRLATEPSFRSSAFLIGSEAHGRSSSVSTEISGISTLDVPLAAATPTANAFLRSSLVCDVEPAHNFQMPTRGDSTEVRHEEKSSSSPAILRQVEVERDPASHSSALPDYDAAEGDTGESIAYGLSPDGDSMQAQLAALREEVARLRDHVDAPPRYE